MADSTHSLRCVLFLLLTPGLLSTALVTAQSSSVPAKKYSINLDLPAEERWSIIAADHAPAIAKLASELGQLVPQAVMKIFEGLKLDVANVLPHPYGLELVGLAKAANVSEKELLLANMVYELTAYKHTNGGNKACTSIISQTSNGTIIHARNFDYSLSDALRNLVIEVDFMENGQVAYTGTTFAGLIGLPSGQRPHRFTISINERDSGEWWMNAFEAILTGTHGIAALAVRDTLANPELDFKMAVESLADRPLITGMYIIMGGLTAGEGVVITRGRPRAIDQWWLGTNHSWFLVETNYDHWEAPPARDDRRDPAIKGMTNVGQAEMSLSKLVDVLSIPPVVNKGTIFTNVMSASMPDQYKSWVRVPN